MSDVVEGILSLDVAGEHDKIVEYIVREKRDPTQLVYVVYQLLLRSSFRGAFIVARALRAAGDVNPIVAFAEGLGGALFADAASEADGKATLQGAIDGLPADKQAMVYTDIISKTLPQLIYHFFTNDDAAAVVRLLEVIKAGVPRFRTIFDISATPPPLNLEEMRHKGRERAKMVQFAIPPPGAPRVARRAVVAVREYFLLVHTGSRLCDVGPRITEAMNLYGWSARYCGMPFQNPEQDYRDIAAACRDHNAEILVLDDNVIQIEQVRVWRRQLIAQLRQDLPALKIVAVYFDPWMLKSADLIDAAAAVDLVWTPFPSMPIWKHPEFADKVCLAPTPPGVELDLSPAPLRPRLTFVGGVMGYNWHRGLWLGAAQHAGLPIDRQLSTHKPDGLPVLESYGNYLRRLADATGSVNFSMREDLSQTATSRTFETTLSGALLVEEWSPDIDYYYAAGEHYLPFSSFSELWSIIRFVEENPDQAEEIRRNGTRFAREKYGNANIIANIDYLLFHARRGHSDRPNISKTPESILRLPLPQTRTGQGGTEMTAEITHPAQPTLTQYMNDGAPVITIGRFSYINKMNTISVDNRSRIVIGNFTSIAWDVLFLLRSNHHPEWVTTYPVDWFPWDASIPRPTDPHVMNKDNITVGSDVWIGKGVTIMPGITIGDGAIIAADAVVTKDVRPYAIVAGNPGREIRRRFDEDTIDYLLKVKWWDQPNDFIIKHCQVICSADFEKLRQILPSDRN